MNWMNAGSGVSICCKYYKRIFKSLSCLLNLRTNSDLKSKKKLIYYKFIYSNKIYFNRGGQYLNKLYLNTVFNTFTVCILSI